MGLRTLQRIHGTGYSPECVEGVFSEVRGSKLPRLNPLNPFSALVRAVLGPLDWE
jgi:hypothetical protein